MHIPAFRDRPLYAPTALLLPEMSLRAPADNNGNGISDARFFEWRRSESSFEGAPGGSAVFGSAQRSPLAGEVAESISARRGRR